MPLLPVQEPWVPDSGVIVSSVYICSLCPYRVHWHQHFLSLLVHFLSSDRTSPSPSFLLWYCPYPLHLCGTLPGIVLCAGSHLPLGSSPLHGTPAPGTLAVAFITDVCHWCTTYSLLGFFLTHFCLLPLQCLHGSQKNLLKTQIGDTSVG